MGIGVLLFTLTGALASVPQGAGLPPNLQRIQDASVAAERREQFFAKYEAADETLRAGAADALAALRPDGRRLDGWPTTDELAVAIRVLDGGELAELQADPLIAFADRIGLLVAPGVANVEPERGEPLTVRVHLTSRAVLEGVVEVSLYWRSPDGTEERVRREPFPADAFLRAFPVYIRAPKVAGAWELVPEVTYEGRAARGFGAPFETIPELEKRLQEADRSSASGERLGLLRDHGVRTTSAPEVAEWPANAGTLVMATSRDEGPGAFHHGPLGERWRALARDRSLALVVVPASEVASLLERITTPTYLVARGDAVADLHLALLGKDVNVAGIILSTTMEAPGPALPKVPTLMIGPSTGTGGPTPFLTEPDLPALVRPWLEEQLE